jgi:hypothetical protein
VAKQHRTRAWRKLRDQVVAEEPWCWLRYPGICTGRSQTADHVLTVKARPDLAMDRANLRGACRPCNGHRNDRPAPAATLTTDGFLSTTIAETPAVAAASLSPGGGAGLAVPLGLLWRPGELARFGWLAGLLDVPGDSSPPLAMTPPPAEAVGSYGAEACAWIEDTQRITLRWWQRLAITRQLEHDAEGRLVWRSVVESCPRRAGKSVRLRGLALWRMAHAALFGEVQTVLHTGSDMAICREIQRGAWRWAEGSGWTVTRANGKEAIESPGGDRWLVRSQDAVYGYDVCLALVDEAWDVKPDTVSEGLEPATLERASPQLHLTSTAHRRATSLMRSWLATALGMSDESTLLMLWGVPADADPADPEVWRAASPYWSPDRERMIGAKYERALAGEVDPQADDPDPMAGFAAQYVNRWPPVGRVEVDPPAVDPGVWSTRANAKVRRPGRVVVAVDVSPDRRWTSLGMAGVGTGGRTLVVVKRLEGTAGTVAALVRLRAKRDVVEVCLHPGGQAGALIPALVQEGIEFHPLTTRELGQATARLIKAVEDGEVEHLGQAELAEAVPNARTRLLGEAEVWDRRDPKGPDISPVVAASEALLRWEMQPDDDYDVLESIG